MTEGAFQDICEWKHRNAFPGIPAWALLTQRSIPQRNKPSKSIYTTDAVFWGPLNSSKIRRWPEWVLHSRRIRRNLAEGAQVSSVPEFFHKVIYMLYNLNLNNTNIYILYLYIKQPTHMQLLSRSLICSPGCTTMFNIVSFLSIASHSWSLPNPSALLP